MRSLNTYNASEMADFVERQFRHYKLFYTHNHPTELLMLFLFKNLMKRKNIVLDLAFLERMIRIPLMYGVSPPMYEMDQMLHNFTYQQPIEWKGSIPYPMDRCTGYPFVPQKITDELRSEWLR